MATRMTRSRGLVALAALAATLGTARLGVWQLDRAHEKTQLAEARDARAREPALGVAELPRNAAAVDALAERRVRVDGVWLADATVYLDNRPMAGRSGFVVVTPLLLDDGGALLVQRGWLPRDQLDRTRIVSYRTDAGRVQVEGRLSPQLPRVLELGPGASGAIRQNIDVAEHARALRRTLLPVVVVQERGATDAPDGLERQWVRPAADVHKNHGYAAQWFGLSLLTAALYVWFQIIRPWRQRRARAGDPGA